MYRLIFWVGVEACAFAFALGLTCGGPDATTVTGAPPATVTGVPGGTKTVGVLEPGGAATEFGAVVGIELGSPEEGARIAPAIRGDATKLSVGWGEGDPAGPARCIGVLPAITGFAGLQEDGTAGVFGFIGV